MNKFTFDEPLSFNLKVGKTYISRGGWDVLVIWKPYDDISGCVYAVHKPHAEGEVVPVLHHASGKAHAFITISSPPDYGQNPADIIKEKKMREINKGELFDWIDDLIVDAGVDKPYKMDKDAKQIYYKILDIIENYFTEGEKDKDG